MKPIRLAAAAVFAALLVAGLALAGCGDASAVESGPISVQTAEALDVLPGGMPLVGMVDFAAARQSGSTAALLNGPMGPFGADGDDLDRFVQMTGFDPATDLDRVYLAGAPDRESGALVVIARFDRDRIERALEENADGELVRSEIDGVPLWTRAEGGGALALPNERMMLAGTEAAVIGMVERLARGTQGLSADADLMALVQKARHREDAWFVTRGLDAGAQTVMGPVGELAETMVVSLDFQNAGLALDAYLAPRPGAAASDVADVARGAVSAARAKASDEPALMAMLDGVDVQTEGSGVRLSMDVPQAVLDQSARHDVNR